MWKCKEKIHVAYTPVCIKQINLVAYVSRLNPITKLRVRRVRYALG